MVTLLAVLEHIPHERVAATLAEIRRVLKPGGLLLLTTPAPRARPLLEWLAFRLRVISARDIADHKHYYGEEELRHLCAAFSDFRYTPFLLGLNQRAIATR